MCMYIHERKKRARKKKRRKMQKIELEQEEMFTTKAKAKNQSCYSLSSLLKASKKGVNEL